MSQTLHHEQPFNWYYYSIATSHNCFVMLQIFSHSIHSGHHRAPNYGIHVRYQDNLMVSLFWELQKHCSGQLLFPLVIILTAWINFRPSFPGKHCKRQVRFSGYNSVHFFMLPFSLKLVVKCQSIEKIFFYYCCIKAATGRGLTMGWCFLRQYWKTALLCFVSFRLFFPCWP